MMRESVIELIHQHAPLRLIPIVEQNIKESLLLRTNRMSEEHIPIGKARIGGRPDLPIHIEWPTWKNEPLSFIAQLNLADLPDYDFLNILPPEGILSFFYSANLETWSNPCDKNSWRVLYFEDKGLRRQEYPPTIPDHGRYDSLNVEFQWSITIPDWETPYLNMGYGESGWEEINKYMDMHERITALLNEGRILNRLLGHPEQQQCWMPRECQLESHGMYGVAYGGHSAAEVEAAEAGATEWELLLQIDSDDDARMMWGDCGRLYYWIPREELQRRNFDATWLILQCG
jgi:uncharacterized protein YwqG